VPDKNTLLTLYLWDLRTQMEAQMRCLTNVQQVVDGVGGGRPVVQPAQVTRVLADLADIGTIAGRVSEIAGEARAEAERTLPTQPGAPT
jgi:hypothetical protein